MKFIFVKISGNIQNEAMFFNTLFKIFQMIFHLVISIILVFVGSFLHTAGAIAILLYRFLLLGGIYRHNVLLGDCIFVR